MRDSEISINVKLDDEKVPQDIKWSATDSLDGDTQTAKALVLALWNGEEKTAMRIDLWTKDMTMDEMADFYYQILVTMGDTFQRATGKKSIVSEIKRFANDFHDLYARSEGLR